MLLRFVTGAALLCCTTTHLPGTAPAASVLQLIEAAAAIFLLIGFWTPIAGAIVAGRQLWIVLSAGGEIWLPLVLATLGTSLAMIGPGAWSIDALIFGRKQIRPRPR